MGKLMINYTFREKEKDPIKTKALVNGYLNKLGRKTLTKDF